VDLNRSIGNPRLYSEATRDAPRAIRQEILECCYFPYRNGVEDDIAEAVRQGNRVIHISSHSFTPELNGEVRNADVGFLYDPARRSELDFCNRWRTSIRTRQPSLKVRRNYPYRGTSDGFAAYLRRRFSPDAYMGIELEINQKHVFEGARPWASFRRLLLETLHEVISSSKYVARDKLRYANKAAAARP
jgi:predicted N-formylglutamate amidohydrolase